MAKKIKKYEYPEGGNIIPGSTKSVVLNNYWRPQTRHNIGMELIKAGAMGPVADTTATLNMWNSLPPQETLKYMDRSKGFDYTVGNTANPGGLKYWRLEELPVTNPKRFKSGTFNEPYLKAKKSTPEYGEGGILEGVSNALGVLGPLGSVAGGVFNMISNLQQKKEEEREAQRQVEMGIRNNQIAGNASWQRYMATGGIVPNGVEVEVEDGETMRNPQDGSMVEVSGPTHAEGGIDISAQPGTEIFGKLIIKDGKYKGMQYKEAASQIRKKIAALQKKLEK